ncbi:MAG: hypothetical protein M3436_03555 [Pseudomonadota bacterium]|nr:hypothetical protein [Pseudomonadota bacterium]
MSSAVKETVSEVKEFFGSSGQGREGQQPSAGQGQGQQPSQQQGFGAGSGQQGQLQGSSNQRGGSPSNGWIGAKQGEHMDRGEYFQALALQQYVTLNQECKTLKQDPNVYDQCQKHAESVRDKIAGMAEQGT